LADPFAQFAFGQIDDKNIFVADQIRKIHEFAQSRKNRPGPQFLTEINLHFNQFIAPFRL
jgi:hypothetical protein